MELQFSTLAARVKLSAMVAQKAGEVFRLAQSAQASGGLPLAPTTPCLMAVCLAVAARTITDEVFSAAQQDECARQSGVPAVSYKRALAAVQGVLNLAPKYTLRELAVRFGCAEFVAAAAALLDRTAAQMPVAQRKCFDVGRSVYAAAALEVVANKSRTAAVRRRAGDSALEANLEPEGNNAGSASDEETQVQRPSSHTSPSAQSGTSRAPRRRIGVSVAEMVKTCGCQPKEFRSALALLKSVASAVSREAERPPPVPRARQPVGPAYAVTAPSESAKSAPVRRSRSGLPTSSLPSPPPPQGRPLLTAAVAPTQTFYNSVSASIVEKAKVFHSATPALQPAAKKVRASLEPYALWRERMLEETSEFATK